jgi:hypothetical protein
MNSTGASGTCIKRIGRKTILWTPRYKTRGGFGERSFADMRPLSPFLKSAAPRAGNLYALAQEFPNAKFFGIDISAHAIRTGTEWLAAHNAKNISLEVGVADDLSRFADKSVDIIFTDAVLIYLGAEKIRTALYEMIRVAKKALVIVEWHTDAPRSLYQDHWAHNYRALLSAIAPVASIQFSRLPADIQNARGNEWSKYGYIIEVKL